MLCVARYLETVRESDAWGRGGRMISVTHWLTGIVVDVGFEGLRIVRAVSLARGLVLSSECPRHLAVLLRHRS